MKEKMNTEDKARFEEMYLAYQNVLRRIAYKYDIPPDYIDDVVQDTFVAYADYKYDLELPEYRKKILLIRILFSRCMDYHRKMRYIAPDEEVLEDSGKEGCFAGLHHLSLPEFVVSKERCQAILKEIDKMPESWRDIAILRLIEGRPTREVCEILHITEKACYSRVSRIRKYFEDLFKRDNWP